MSQGNFSFYRDQLTEAARRLVWKHCEGGPPYDPFAIAGALNVAVKIEFLEGIEGYTEYEGGRFLAVVNSRSIATRRRFTLAHELGHVHLIAAAQRVPISLERYRGARTPNAAHGDPVEETLCNAFAAELLLPAEEIQQRLVSHLLEPQTVLEVAKVYGVSIHASAKRIVKLFGQNRIGFSLWGSPRPGVVMPVWWTGLHAPASSRRRMERFVTEAMSCGKEMIECWDGRARKNRSLMSRTEVRVIPFGKSGQTIVWLRERGGERCSFPSPSIGRSVQGVLGRQPRQLELFS